VALCGDSAGGCLALLLARHIRDKGLPAPRALGLIAPVADLSGDIAERFARARDEMLIPPQWAARIRALALPDVDSERPDISPLKGDLRGLPPALIQAGAEEALAEDATRLAAAMDDTTLDLWPGLPHVWHIHAGRSAAADRAIAAMAAFLARQTR
jgi:acetyl esterase/lipase